MRKIFVLIFLALGARCSEDPIGVRPPTTVVPLPQEAEPGQWFKMTPVDTVVNVVAPTTAAAIFRLPDTVGVIGIDSVRMTLSVKKDSHQDNVNTEMGGIILLYREGATFFSIDGFPLWDGYQQSVTLPTNSRGIPPRGVRGILVSFSTRYGSGKINVSSEAFVK